MRLSPEQLRTLSEAVPAEAVAGDRYPAALLKHLDSETAAD